MPVCLSYVNIRQEGIDGTKTAGEVPQNVHRNKADIQKSPKRQVNRVIVTRIKPAHNYQKRKVTSCLKTSSGSLAVLYRQAAFPLSFCLPKGVKSTDGESTVPLSICAL